MDSMRRSLLAVALLPLATVALPARGDALTKEETACSAAITRAAREFTAAKHGILIACNNQIVKTDTCNEAKRDARLERATNVLGRAVAKQCRNEVLENLGFPAACPDADGAPFSVANLATCIQETGTALADMALLLEYPDVANVPAADAKCQSAIGGASQAYLRTALRARAKCLKLEAKGKIPPEADCRAPVPPTTGHDPTDEAITDAAERLSARLAKRCAATDLTGLGFPGDCTDPDGDPFNDENLAACLLAALDLKVDAVLAASQPPLAPQ
jgi:hypothetical protein